MEPQNKQNSPATNDQKEEQGNNIHNEKDSSVEAFLRDITPEKKIKPKHVKRDLKSSIRTYYSDVAQGAEGQGGGAKQESEKKPEVHTKPEPKPKPKPVPKIEQPDQEPVQLPTAQKKPDLKRLHLQEQEQVPPQKAPAPEPIPEQRKEERSEPVSIRTFQSDVKEKVSKEGVSIADIALAEQKRRQREVQEVQMQERKSGIGVMLLLSAILLLGGGGIFAYLFVYQPAQEEEMLPDYTTLFFPDQELVVHVGDNSGIDFEQGVREAIENTDGVIGSITALVFTQEGELGDLQQIGGQEFISRLETNAPTAFIRSLEEEFSFAVHHFGDHNEQFVVLTTNFFESAFAGMLEWEASIAQDLSFVARPPAEPDTTRSFGGEYTFKDLVLENRDTRALINEGGDIRLIYTFPDQNTLVIASNETTLKEAIQLLLIAEQR